MIRAIIRNDGDSEERDDDSDGESEKSENDFA